MSLGFSHPLFLLALLLLPLVIWIERRAWTDLVAWRRRTVLGCRLLQIALIVLALSGLRWERAREEVAVLFAVDASRSVSEEERDAALQKIAAATDSMRPEDQAGLIVFGRQALIERAPQSRLRVDAIESEPDPDFTDLASVLRLASGIYPEGMRRRLVIFSDGNENLGNAMEAIRSAQAAGIGIDVYPMETAPSNEVSLTRLDVPGRIEKDEPFELKVEALATDAGDATLRLFRDGASIGSRDVYLTEGRNSWSVTLTEEDTGFHTYEAVIEAPQDMHADNNMAGAYTRVAGPSKVLLVGSDRDNAPLENALELSKLPHESRPSLPATLAGLQNYDAIFLNNISAFEFSDEQLSALENYVKDLGGGLGMIGGENSFGPGGWIGTPVEDAMPVDMELKTKERFPSLALVMVIDKSGSMAGHGGQVSKMDLANRAAVEAVNLLGPRDLVGVIAFDSAGKWVVPLGSADNKAQIAGQIRSIRSGGGTDAYQGARMAYDALTRAEARLKHVILLTDGQTAPSDFEKLVAQMNAGAITLTTIAIGADADRLFLRDLANRGNGRFYFVPEASRVPKVFVRETVLAQRSYIKEEVADPVLSAVHPIFAGDESGLPPIHGWDVTELKDRAEAVLRVQEDPLLATWNYGLGKSVAFTSDVIPRWAVAWNAWDGFMPFLDRMIRWSLRGASSNQLFPRIEVDRGRGRLVVDAATEEGRRLNFLDLKARVIRPDLTVEEIPLRQTAVGTYELEFDAEDPGAYLAGVFDSAGRQASAGAMVAFSPEFKDFESNDYLLHEMARQTGGEVSPRTEQIFRREGRRIRSAREIFWPLLSIALLLLLVEIAVRRLYFDEEQRERAAAALRRAFFLPVPRTATAGGPDLESGVPAGLKMRSKATKEKLRRGAERAAAPGATPSASAAEPSAFDSHARAASSSQTSAASGATPVSPVSHAAASGAPSAAESRPPKSATPPVGDPAAAARAIYEEARAGQPTPPGPKKETELGTLSTLKSRLRKREAGGPAPAAPASGPASAHDRSRPQSTSAAHSPATSADASKSASGVFIKPGEKKPAPRSDAPTDTRPDATKATKPDAPNAETPDQTTSRLLAAKRRRKGSD